MSFHYLKIHLLSPWNFLLTLVMLTPSIVFSNGSPQEETSDQEHDKDEQTTVVQVIGIRGSLVKSLNTKRLSNSIVDAVSAEDIGKFPDQNVAESLQRITGVSISRSFGEGERISIRGTTSSQNRTLFNGQAVGSVDWWTNSSANRGFNFTLLPSEIVSNLEVYKSPEADIDEGSIGGTVIVRTRKPLDLVSHQFSGSILAQFSEVSGKTDPQLSALYNWKSHDENLGALFSVIRQKRSLRRDGIESWSWTKRDITMEDGTVYQDVYSSGGGGSAMFSQVRERTGYNLAIQYLPSDRSELSFNLLDSTLDANNENQNFLWLPSYGGSQYTSINLIEHPVVGTMAVGGILGLSPTSDNILNETKIRDSKLTTQYYDLTYKHSGDIWDSHVQVGYTEGKGGSHNDRSVGWGGNYVHSYDASHIKDIRTTYNADPGDASQWDLSFLRYDNNFSKDRESFFQSDFLKAVDLSLFSQIKMGIKLRNHSRFKTKSTTDPRTDLNWNLSDYSLNMPTDFLSNQGSAGTLDNYAITDSNRVRLVGDALNWNYRTLKASTFDIQEKITAGYIKADIRTDGLRGNLGMRFVKTEQNSSAYVGASGSEVWTTHSKTYFDILPSLNVVFDLDKDVLFRVSAARVMSRPDYADMSSSTSYNLQTQTGSGGNSDLAPYRASQFDAGIEWYFNQAGLVSAALFLKDIQSFINSKASLETHENVEILINRPVNGNGGTIKGLELNYQQDIALGFGLSANYTYVDGEAKDDEGHDVTIPGNSKHTINLSSYYESNKISGRLSYNFRTGYDTGRGWPGFIDDYGQIDLNFNYKATENMSITFEVINLTEEQTFSYQQKGVKQALTGVYADGRRLIAGVRVNF